MKKIYLYHLGIGNIGKELISQLAMQEELLTRKYGVEIRYAGLFTSSTGFFNAEGISVKEAKKLILEKGLTQKIDPQKTISEMKNPFICIDTTASDQTIPLLKKALENGGFVVCSNKKPFTGSQKDFDTLHSFNESRLLYETTVGAGLPVIQTIKNLLDTGDEILEIQGCFSGTLGFIFSELEKGTPFSHAVFTAKDQGFTEPDPRDDLSGVDVARKALILARLLGQKKELSDIQLESLFPKKMEKYTVEDFLKNISQLDEQYAQKRNIAAKENKVLRFIAQITPEKSSVQLQAVDKNSDIGSLTGPDNIIVCKTKRYNTNPLIIKGPGAGIEVTAAGVFADIMTVIKTINK